MGRGTSKNVTYIFGGPPPLRGRDTASTSEALLFSGENVEASAELDNEGFEMVWMV